MGNKNSGWWAPKPPVSEDDGELLPYLQYWLVVGEYPAWRCKGWVESMLGAPHREQERIAAIWERHQAAIIADTRDHGFAPYAETRRRPKGPALQRWREQFLSQHEY